MIKLEFENDKTFMVCADWEEVTFGQYVDLVNIGKDNYGPTEKAVRIISALSDSPEELAEYLLNKINQEELEDICTFFDWTNKPIEDLKSDVKELHIDGKTYKIKSDFGRLNLGEQVAIETMLQDNKNLDPLEIAFGVLLREVDADGKELKFSMDIFIEVVTNLKEKVKLIDVYQYLTFFLSTEKNYYTSPTKRYSITKI